MANNPSTADDRFKRFAFLALRVLLAAAGVAFIVWSLHWRDTVSLPAGWTLPGGAVVDQPTVVDVVDVRVTGRGTPVGTLLLALPAETGPASVVSLDADELGTAADEPRFRAGIVTTLRTANLRLLALGVLLVGAMFPLQAARWLMLMRCRGLDVGFARALRLTMLGQFFNFCMPGMTGGDVVKAYYAARRSDNRAAAIMSVVFDRIAGLVGLVLLAALVGLTLLGNPLVLRITVAVWLGIAAVLIASGLYFSQHARRLLHIEALIARLPGRTLFARIDAAAVAYRDHKAVVLWATLLSLPAHLLCAVATALAGYALGMQAPWPVLITVIPVLLLAGSVPLTYQGLGVMEGLAIAMLLDPPLATTNQIVGMLLLLRVFLIVWALAGATTLLRGDGHIKAQAADGTEPVS